MTTMLLEWFATAVFLILAVIVLRVVFGKRVSAGLRYALWGAVLVRLLIPMQLFTSPLAGTRVFFNRSTGQNIYRVTDDPEKGGPDGPTVSVQSPSAITLPDAPDFPDPPQVPDAPEAPGPDWSGWVWLGGVWLAGSAVTALVFLSCNLRFRQRLFRTRTPLEGERAQETRAHDMRPYTTLPVYVAEGLPSPCLFGLARPAIYVTPEAAADPAVLRHVLAHEDTHFRHGDHIWNLLRCAALCLHWWNPLVWLSAVLSRRDGELACDEGALKRLGCGERTAYGATLLTLLTAPSDPVSLLRCATTMAGDKKSLVERISRIARAPKRLLWAAVVAALCLALACVCAFGQMAEEPELLGELDADLSLTMDEEGTVRMTGTVDGMELPRGAAWNPNSTWGKSPSGELSMVYPGFQGLGQHVNAWWADEDRTSVTLTTRMASMFSSLGNVGYWEFTVDLNSGAVTAMDGLSFREGFPDEETRFYPDAISEEEAVQAARVAAKLMEEAEKYYNSTPEPPESLPPSKSPEPPVPADAETVRQARAELLNALLGNADFAYYSDGGDINPAAVDINTAPHTAFHITEEWGKIWGFYAVDLDGDRVKEVVLHVTDVADDMGGYLVLRWAGPGDIRCYPSYWRTFWNLKTDGTFDYDYYTGVSGSARASFPAPGYSMEQHSIMEARYAMDGSDPPNRTFTVNGQSVSQAEYAAARETQNAKPDAVWHEFTPENIIAYVPVG